MERRELERQIMLLKKDAEAEARISQLTVKGLEQSLAVGAAQIAALEKQLSDAKLQVQEIAVRAIDGASGSRALSHINQIAMEQAKNRPQG
jgi:colicin import membrane protein